MGTKENPDAALTVGIAELFEVELQPHQKAFVGQISEIERTRPEGCEVRYFCGGRHSGWFAMRDRRVTHKWDGTEWRPLFSENA